jgi:hypothetical protein
MLWFNYKMEMYVTLISGSLCTDNEFPECILKAKKKKKKP